MHLSPLSYAVRFRRSWFMSNILLQFARLDGDDLIVERLKCFMALQGGARSKAEKDRCDKGIERHHKQRRGDIITSPFPY